MPRDLRRVSERPLPRERAGRECEGELGRGGVPGFRGLLQSSHHDRFEIGGEQAACMDRGGLRSLRRVGEEEDGRVFADERRPAAEKKVKHRPERVHVRGRCGEVQPLLRRGILRRPDEAWTRNVFSD